MCPYSLPNLSVATSLANLAEMIAHGAPRLIHNDEELAAYVCENHALKALPLREA